MSELILYYFPLKARNVFALAVLEYAGATYSYRTPAWPAFKAEAPFGQLPVLVDGEIKVAQSMAIGRYLAKKFNLEGESLADFGMSEQLIEEVADVINLMVKASQSPDKKAAYKTLGDETIPAHFAKLEALLKGDTFGSRVLAGDLAIFALLDLVLAWAPSILASFPKLKAFYDKLAATPGGQKYLSLPYKTYYSPGP